MLGMPSVIWKSSAAGPLSKESPAAGGFLLYDIICGYREYQLSMGPVNSTEIFLIATNIPKRKSHFNYHICKFHKQRKKMIKDFPCRLKFDPFCKNGKEQDTIMIKNN
jgi:hypothetical protein